ncbi:MAG: alpha-(1-_3)-arabinofuranosyltransferase domain-containing protein, partial [Microthrixaceae bacterium]
MAVSYVPLLLTAPGKVGADTKTYLYLNPGRLLSRAPYMWDANIGLGTVTHQNIGYLWPMGPYYFVLDAIGLPDWVAQRLWLGSIVLAAGLGVRWMMKELRWQGAGVTVAAFAYALSPYLLDYAARISVILLPFAGLPWLIGLSARALRRQDWRTPAVFALVTLTVGGVNATSLLLVMVAPMLWFVYATFVEREVSFPDALRTAGRITVLTAITSLWWVAGLVLQGSFGIPILRYTETYETVAASALAPELMRGLGYWFFYGRDGLGPWTQSTITMVQALPALALSYLIPGLALASGVLTRWRHRVFFASIIVVGLIIGVGAHPWDAPTPYGSVFKAWTRSDMGLSFRSTPRAVPLIVLGLAVFLGSGVAALSRWRPRLHRPVAAVLLVLLCLNQIALFRGQMVDRNLQRDEELPSYWLDAAEAANAGDPETRVLEMPGIDFAAYRWGNTVDPITPGLIDRDFVARELIPYGSPPSANLLNSVDQPFQAGRADPRTIAPLARLMGIGDILFRADLQFERFLSPRPRHTFQHLLAAPGLGAPTSFGEAVPNEATPELPLDDELAFGTPVTDPDPAPVTLFPVLDPRTMIRAVDASSPVLMAGDGNGIVNLASSGGLQVDRPLFYVASFAGSKGELQELLDEPDASLVITDTNRRQARRWGSVRENDGFTERAGETAPVEDMTDNRLDVFPDETDAERTVVEQTGGATIEASAYGNGVTYTAGDRPVNAMDGTESTSWRVAAFEQAEGHFIDLDLAEPVTTDHLSLRQVVGFKNRWMTGITITFDDEPPVRFELDDSSKEPGGQTLTFPERTFDHLLITVDSTDRGILADYKGVSDVGISELVIPGVAPVSEVVRPSVAVLDAAGEDSIDHPLSYVFARRAPNPGDVIVADEEPTMRRFVDGPVARAFTPFGRARMAAKTPDAQVDQLLGVPSAAEGGVTAESSKRLEGTLRSRASMAVDGDPTTSFRSAINDAAGVWTRFTYPEPVSIDG